MLQANFFFQTRHKSTSTKSSVEIIDSSPIKNREKKEAGWQTVLEVNAQPKRKGKSFNENKEASMILSNLKFYQIRLRVILDHKDKIITRSLNAPKKLLPSCQCSGLNFSLLAMWIIIMVTSWCTDRTYNYDILISESIQKDKRCLPWYQ